MLVYYHYIFLSLFIYLLVFYTFITICVILYIWQFSKYKENNYKYLK